MFAGEVVAGLEIGGLQAFVGGWKAAALAVVQAGRRMAQAMHEIVTTTATAGDQYQKMAQRLSMSAQTLSEMDFALQQSGSTLADFEVGMRSLTRVVGEATEGNKRALQMFADLGVKIADVNGHTRKAEDIFTDVAAALKGMSNDMDRASLAIDLFGRSGTNMIPLVMSDMEALRAEARRLGNTYSDVEADASALFNDEMNRAATAVKGLWKEIGMQLMPWLQSSYTAIANMLPMLTEWLQRNKWIADTLGHVGAGLNLAWKAIVIFTQNVPKMSADLADFLTYPFVWMGQVALKAFTAVPKLYGMMLEEVARELETGFIKPIQAVGGVVGQRLIGWFGGDSVIGAAQAVIDKVRETGVELQITMDNTAAAVDTGASLASAGIRMMAASSTQPVVDLVNALEDLRLKAIELPQTVTASPTSIAEAGPQRLHKDLSYMEKLLANFSERGRRRVQTLGNAFSSVFSDMVQSGKKMSDALLDATKGAIGAMASQEGDFHIKAGLAQMWQPGQHAQGLARMLKGLALRAFGATLGGGGGGGESGGGGGGGEAGGGSQPGYEVTEEPKRAVTVNVFGDLLDSPQTGVRLVEIINENADRDVKINAMAVAMS